MNEYLYIYIYITGLTSQVRVVKPPVEQTVQGRRNWQVVHLQHCRGRCQPVCSRRTSQHPMIKTTRMRPIRTGLLCPILHMRGFLRTVAQHATTTKAFEIDQEITGNYELPYFDRVHRSRAIKGKPQAALVGRRNMVGPARRPTGGSEEAR